MTCRTRSPTPTIRAELRRVRGLGKDELHVAAKELQATYVLVREVAEQGKLPVALFTAGGIATPSDAAMVGTNAKRFARIEGGVHNVYATA